MSAPVVTGPGAARVASIYVNLPVRDLPLATAFYAGLGFALDPRVGDANAACVVLGETIRVMLLGRERFASFAPGPVADSRRSTAVLLCIAVGSRAEVDGTVAAALSGGGTVWAEPQDHGFMYGHGFRDPDGHCWEVIHLPPAGEPPG